MSAKFTKLVFSRPELGPAQPQLVTTNSIQKQLIVLPKLRFLLVLKKLYGFTVTNQYSTCILKCIVYMQEIICPRVKIFVLLTKC